MPVNFEKQITRTVPGFSLLSPDATNPLFKSTDILTQPPGEYLPDGTPVWGRCSAIGAAGRNRLVETAKCPTDNNNPELDRIRAERDSKNRAIRDNHDLWTLLRDQQRAAIEAMEPGKEKTRLQREFDKSIVTRVRELEPENNGTVPYDSVTDIQIEPLLERGEWQPARRKEEGTAGQAYTIITHRDWSEEYRIRTQVDQCHAIPPEQEGERITHTLSMGGATKIADSCQYMHLKKGGYKTFLTLTVEPEQRKKLEAGEITIQKELGRFWDAMNKIRQRGFSYTAPGGVKRRIKGVSGRNILYCWVVENPLNQAGERNPHIHILMDWGVPYGPKNSAGIGCIFDAWAKRVEGVWGHGFATLEKMKDTENAGAYLAKAAGYLSKANGESEQGPVKGNRYGISRDSRAPDWVQVGRYEMGIMGSLIADTHDYFSALYGGHFAKRARLKKALDETPKQNKKQRFRIGKALGKVRKALNRLPAIASKYQLMIKGKERFEEFRAWATSEETQPGNDWLPPKAEGDAWHPEKPRPDSNWYKEFQLRMFAKRAGRRFWGMPLSVYKQCIERAEDWEQGQAKQSEIFNSWVQYQGVSQCKH